MFESKIFACVLYMLCFCCYVMNFSTAGVTAECNQFFPGKPWPTPKNANFVVKLCQTELKKVSANTCQLSNIFYPTLNVIPIEAIPRSPAYYATLFDTSSRTPLYSANTVTLYREKPPKRLCTSTLWKREAAGLCFKQPPKSVVYSDIANQNNLNLHGYNLKLCKEHQAVSNDYNNKNFHRGHLTPLSINRKNSAKWRATCTLTNAAPQYRQFNQGGWKSCELFVERFIRKYAPGEVVYIMTGVYGWIPDGGQVLKLNNRVTVPRYFWKALCYPGNTYDAFGFAFMRENTAIKNNQKYGKFVPLNQFAKSIFNDPQVFPANCANVPFQIVLQNINSVNVKRNC